jgi:hypothetical protein
VESCMHRVKSVDQDNAFESVHFNT